MKPSITLHFKVFILLVLIGCPMLLSAQQTAVIGAGSQSGTSSNGATGDPGPIYRSSSGSSFDYSRHHYLYTQTELAGAGILPGSVISKLAWFKDNTTASNGNFHFEIWMKNSSLTSVPSASQTWANLTSGSTQVYNTNSQTLSSTTGFKEFTLTTPFTYTGGAIEISVHHACNMISGSPFTGGISWKKDPISNRTISQCGSSNSTTLNNNRTVRPQLQITYSSCTAPSGLNVSNITASGATITWTAVSGSQGYEYVIDQTAANPTGAGTAVGSATVNATGLLQSTNYYVHVRNKCNSTSYSSWVTEPFTTLTSCFPPTNIVASNLTASTGTISWVAPSVSSGFEYKIDQNATAPSGGFLATVTPVANFSGHNGGETYYAHVRNVCAANDKSNWITQMFVMPECLKPTNVIISNITDTSADVLWSQMSGANGYEYAVDFSSLPPTAGIKHTTSITANLTGLTPNSKYYLHTRSNCFVSDKSSWKLDSFVTLMGCYPPIVQVNHLGTNAPYAYWDEVPTAIAYEYTVTGSAKSPAFGTTIYTPFTSLTLDEDGKDKYLHVRTKCNSMFTSSDWSVVQLREGTTSVTTVAGADAISIYPNPVVDKLYIKGAGDRSFRLTNLTGQVVSQGILSNDYIITKDLSPGVYQLRLGDNSRVYKIVKQ